MSPETNRYEQIMESSRQSLSTLKKNDIAEILKLKSPPQGVTDLLNCIYLLLGAKTEKDRQEKMNEIRTSSGFLSQLMNFDIENIDFSTLKKVKKFVEKYSDDDYYSRVSKACQ